MRSFARRDVDLFLHEVDPGDHLGHRVLDLDAGVHLDEIKLAVLVKELERSGAAVADPAAGVDAALADPVTQLGRQLGGRRLLQHLLVAPLQRAVALAQMHHVLVRVGKHLDLDVARLLEIALEVDRRICKGRLRFAARHVDGVEQRRLRVHDAHAAPATAAGGLDDHGIADLARDAHDFLRIFGQRALGAGHRGNPGFHHRRFGTHLVAHQADVLRPRAREHEARALDLLGEVGVLGEEAVAGMDCFGIGDLGGADDRRDIEVARRRWR